MAAELLIAPSLDFSAAQGQMNQKTNQAEMRYGTNQQTKTATKILG